MRPHHLTPHRGSRLSGAVAPGSAAGVSAAGTGIKHRMKEQEEYIRDWTAHSEEIARYGCEHVVDVFCARLPVASPCDTQFKSLFG